MMLIAVAVAMPEFSDQKDDFSADYGVPSLMVSSPIVPLAVQQGEDIEASSSSLNGEMIRTKRHHRGGYGGYGGNGGYGGYGGYGGGYGG